MDDRVSSTLASFGGTVGNSPGCPESSPSVSPVDELSGRPECCIFRQCQSANLRVAPNFHSSATPIDGSSSFLESRTFRRLPLRVFGFPRILHGRLGR